MGSGAEQLVHLVETRSRVGAGEAGRIGGFGGNHGAGYCLRSVSLAAGGDESVDEIRGYCQQGVTTAD